MKSKTQNDFLFSFFKQILIVSVIFEICIGALYFFFFIKNQFFESDIIVQSSSNDGGAPHILDEPDKINFPGESNENTNMQMVLDNTSIPIRDPIWLAEKYQKVKNVPVMLAEPPVKYSIGDSRKFWVLNVDENDYKNIKANLAYQTPHVYFWIEQGIDYRSSDVKKVVENFEENIYPKNRGVFGSEWSPGIDNDIHLTILYAHNLGGAAGYYSSSDTLMREIDEYSNMAEMFYLSADYIDLKGNDIGAVLAHEFQHMIHWNVDRNETSWVNEGLSELAVELNGFEPGGFSFLFAHHPDIQLNFWPGNDQGETAPHYGASYMFMKYLYERFGEAFISDLVSQPENGFQGLDAVLSFVIDADLEIPLTSENIFQDWAIANILQEDTIDSGIYQYGEHHLPTFSPIKSIPCGADPENFSVNQFGADYYEIVCDEDYEISINWEKNVHLLLTNPYSGSYYYWSNRADESSTRLFREFDLTDVSGSVELSYKTWFDIERDYDYLYVNVSRDGKIWDNLEPAGCTRSDPTGSNLGCGYNGKSSGWIEENIDISEYAGKAIILEFEYITDAAVTGEGFLLDDVKIDAIDFFEDFEKNDHDWIAEGFVCVHNSIPQIIGITIANFDTDIQVEKFILREEKSLSREIHQQISNRADIIAISGLSRYTQIPMQYQITVKRLD